MGPTTRVSVDEYLSYQAPAGFRDEIIEGEIVLSPDPKPIHADIAKQLDTTLTAALRGSPFLVRQRINMLLKDDQSMPSPNVFVLGKARWQEAMVQNKYPVGSPQLAIEIQSPSNSRPRLRTKVELYLENGSFCRLGGLSGEANGGRFHGVGRGGVPNGRKCSTSRSSRRVCHSGGTHLQERRLTAVSDELR